MWDAVQSVFGYNLFNISFSRIILAVLVAVFFFGLRQPFVRMLVKLIKRVNNKTRLNLDEQLVGTLEMSARLMFIIMGMWLASIVMELPEDIRRFITHVVRSMVAFLIFWTAYRGSYIISVVVQKLTEKARTKLDGILISFLCNGVKVMIVVFGTIVIIQEWGYDVGGLLAGLGLGGLAFALAAKDTAANLFGSVMIMIDRPFMIGDSIMTQHGEGTVEEIGFRSTRIRTFAQALVTIPNSVMSNDAITNWSRMGKRRISFRLRLTYRTDAARLKECLSKIRELLAENPEVDGEPPLVYFERFGESGLEIYICFFVKAVEWKKFLEAQEEINLSIMRILEELGLSVAYPSTSVYIEDGKSSHQEEKH